MGHADPHDGGDAAGVGVSVSATPLEDEALHPFDDLYVRLDPVGFKEHIMDRLEYIGDDAVRAAFDTHILSAVSAVAAREPEGARVVDLCCCYANTTLACVHRMSAADIAHNWRDAAACKTITHPRRFRAHVTGVDVSENALQYASRAGILDKGIRANLNAVPPAGEPCEENLVAPALRGAHVLIATAAFEYLSSDAVERVVAAFAAGGDTGYCLVTLSHPFAAQRGDAMKQVLLQHLDFVGSGVARCRRLAARERAEHPGFGEWTLAEWWILKRRATGSTPAVSPELHAAVDPCTTCLPMPLSPCRLRPGADSDGLPPVVPLHYDSADTYAFHRALWGGDHLHVGIHDDDTAATPEGPDRVRLACEKSLQKLLALAAPQPGARVMDMGSAYGGAARALARLGAYVSCVDLSERANARNRELSAAAGLAHLVAIPGERSFTSTGERGGSFDIVVSQDSFLYAGGAQRRAAITEASRVLKERGYLVFTDVMCGEGGACDAAGVDAHLRAVGLEGGMGTLAAYREWGEAAGLHFAYFDDMTHVLETHYATARRVLLAQHHAGALEGVVSDAYVRTAADTLESWAAQARAGNLRWGYAVFRKPRETEAPRAPQYKQVPKPAPGGVRQALLCASGRPSGLDSREGPKSLVRLGDLPVICHAIVELWHAGVQRVVVLCGFQGAKVEAAVGQLLPVEVLNGVTIEYVHEADASKGVARSSLAARGCFAAGDRFLLVMGDHVFDPRLLQTAMQPPAPPEAAAGTLTAVVECDCAGMVGLPATALKFSLDKTDLDDLRVRAASETLDPNSTDGVEAGLYVVDDSFFDAVAHLEAAGQVYVSLGDVVTRFVHVKKCRCITTGGRMWFGLETRETLEYAVRDGLKDMGTEDERWLADGAFDPAGRPLWVIPWGQNSEQHGKGVSWKEFSVERWHSAVYVTSTYFEQLYKDTIDFIVGIGKQVKLRGRRCSLIEVGCGTGDFIRPVAPNFRLSIGVDFNANFVEFCNRRIPKGEESRMQFVLGDACELVDLLKRRAPAHIWSDARIVCCLGNTMGIIPEQLKERVYRQMAAAAGEDGVVVVVYWNAACFGDACQNFYHANPSLCGEFDGSAVNFDTCTLRTPPPASYQSHWTGVAEARRVLTDLGLEEIAVEERGKGVLVAARVMPAS